ncbi:hypothetical protein [[Erwinia] mediterraneensis]|uniref:hypothetical protein n=1 Tax=[Erwinia] mediterraneensis TaxID=2161819 RepID=UPI0010303863|nr:hypothetical protein [[Erwinia] mediterraneensis]
MAVPSCSLLMMMSFAAGTFSAGASTNPQHLMLATPDNGVPNNPLPLIIWPRVVPAEEEDVASWFETTFAQHGWPPAWRYPIFPYTHYHPNTHELLGVGAGWAEVLFGGDNGRMVTLRVGDAVLIPAGVGHKQISASEDFFCVGAYPQGLEPQTERDRLEKLKVSQEQIRRVAVPASDPFEGKEGAMTAIWGPVINQLARR